MGREIDVKKLQAEYAEARQLLRYLADAARNNSPELASLAAEASAFVMGKGRLRRHQWTAREIHQEALIAQMATVLARWRAYAQQEQEVLPLYEFTLGQLSAQTEQVLLEDAAAVRVQWEEHLLRVANAARKYIRNHEESEIDLVRLQQALDDYDAFNREKGWMPE